ncbi:LCP family protein [Streptomyces iconiensis]|uniref:LCP family protein n=1 Tax=Streptomyces iconiensis TaxID=1384038 RepID=A0ABT6ZPZ2_9ACTN|nr:LCP family protein [Streptomyces iconiensis]MDJ1131125.1 LCP family protein [Streptomyces iconiensis]
MSPSSAPWSSGALFSAFSASSAFSAPLTDGKGDARESRALTFLLVGLDTRAGLSRERRDDLNVNGDACECTDVMMLLHVSRHRDRVSAVSIPRDSYVRFAPHREKNGSHLTSHRGKINAAHAHGGRELTVRTVQQATGLRIDHYLETDFAGFVAAVDRLGGAPVCTKKPLHDINSGLDMPAGHHHTDGRQALRYVRARHVSPPGDLGRVRRQQQLVAGLLEQLANPRIADHPFGLLRTARALRGTVATDPGLTMSRLARLGGELRGLDGDDMEFATVPLKKFDHRVPTWGSTLTWDEPRARVLFRALREDRPFRLEPRLSPPPGVRPVGLEPGRVPVRVEGGGAAADRLRTALRENGFALMTGPPQAAPDTLDTVDPVVARPGRRTEIRYEPGREREAEVLAAALPDARLRAVRGQGRVLTVLTGSGTRVRKIIYDRSSVEGAPVTGTALDCDATGGTGKRVEPTETDAATGAATDAATGAATSAVANPAEGAGGVEDAEEPEEPERAGGVEGAGGM